MQEKVCHWNWQNYTQPFLKFNLKIFIILAFGQNTNYNNQKA